MGLFYHFRYVNIFKMLQTDMQSLLSDFHWYKLFFANFNSFLICELQNSLSIYICTGLWYSSSLKSIKFNHVWTCTGWQSHVTHLSTVNSQDTKLQYFCRWNYTLILKKTIVLLPKATHSHLLFRNRPGKCLQFNPMYLKVNQ